MTGPTVRSANAAIREVTRGLADARDAQILRAVAMVDAMPVRGAADEIVAPLRPRLARLRPPRPLRLARLLFLPLDPLIVPPPRWRPESASIPRSVIPVIAEAVAVQAGGIEAAIAGHTTEDLAVIERAGPPLWSLAAAMLRDAPVPPGWEAATGLAPRFHGPLARRIAALLSVAETLRLWTADAVLGLPPPGREALRTMLQDVTAIDGAAQPALVALLLARVPAVGPDLTRLSRTSGPAAEGAMRVAAERAAALLLDQLAESGDSQVGGPDLAGAGAAVRRMAALLTLLESDSGDKDRVKQVRGQMARTCEQVFAERLAADLLTPLREGPGAPPPEGLEAIARDLRTFETEARRLGGGDYERGLLGAAESVRAAMAHGDLSPTDGMRLTEILAGPEAALTLLGLEA